MYCDQSLTFLQSIKISAVHFNEQFFSYACLSVSTSSKPAGVQA